MPLSTPIAPLPIVYGFRVDDQNCQCPEQAYAVTTTQQTIGFSLLLPLATRHIYDDVSCAKLKTYLSDKRHFEAHNYNSMNRKGFRKKQGDGVECIVLQSRFDSKTLEPSGPIILYDQHVKVAAYTPGVIIEPRLDGCPQNGAEQQMNDAFDLIDAMRTKRPLSIAPIENYGDLNRRCSELEQQEFVRYARERDFPVLQNVRDANRRLYTKVSRPEKLGDNARGVSCTCPMRDRVSYINLFQAERDHMGLHPFGFNQLARFAEIINKKPFQPNPQRRPQQFAPTPSAFAP